MCFQKPLSRKHIGFLEHLKPFKTENFCVFGIDNQKQNARLIFENTLVPSTNFAEQLSRW